MLRNFVFHWIEAIERVELTLSVVILDRSNWASWVNFVFGNFG